MDNIEKNLSLRWQVYRTHSLVRVLVAAFYERELAAEYVELSTPAEPASIFEVLDAITNP